MFVIDHDLTDVKVSTHTELKSKSKSDMHASVNVDVMKVVWFGLSLFNPSRLVVQFKLMIDNKS